MAQLSTDIRYNQSLSQEMDHLRQDVDAIRNQMMALKQCLIPNGIAVTQRTHQTRDQSREHPSNGHISANGRQNGTQIINPNRVEKLKRFAMIRIWIQDITHPNNIWDSLGSGRPTCELRVPQLN